METLVCAICGQKGLLEANGTKLIGKRLEVCSNEFITHWKVGDRHFLTRTELSLALEPKLPVLNGTFGELVLN